jgi:uncharacterized protein YukE
VSLLPDPQVLDNTATKLEDHADELRTRAARLAATTQSTQWASRAASMFDDRSRTVSLNLTRCANGIDDASAALRAHANTVRDRIADIHAGIAALETAGGAALNDAGHVASSVLKGAGSLIGDVT